MKERKKKFQLYKLKTRRETGFFRIGGERLYEGWRDSSPRVKPKYQLLKQIFGYFLLLNMFSVITVCLKSVDVHFLEDFGLNLLLNANKSAVTYCFLPHQRGMTTKTVSLVTFLPKSGCKIKKTHNIYVRFSIMLLFILCLFTNLFSLTLAIMIWGSQNII